MAYNPAYMYLAVEALCPGLKVFVDFELSDSGEGPFISRWSTDKYPQPTQQQLATVDTEALFAPLKTVTPQDLMAQFAPADMVKITAAISADTSGQTALLWYSMVAQRDPMVVGNDRFRAGAAALATVLGSDRMAAIWAALGVTV